MADHRLAVRVAAIGVGIAALAATLVAPPAPRLVWNASASAPLGLYRVMPGAPVRSGDMVIAWVPDPARAFAARRRYIPANVPLVKRVAAAAGDRICARGDTVSVNGRQVAMRFAFDGSGRAMPWWCGCVVLGPDELLLLMTDSPASFDGRYFGISRRGDLVGRATFLWGPR